MKNAITVIALFLAVFGLARADFIAIGNLNNPADGNGLGSVSYQYSIGKYEVTSAEAATAITADSRIGTRAGEFTGDLPAGRISWYEATRYCNWLTTGDAYTGVYQYDGSGTLTNTLSRSEVLSGALDSVSLTGKIYALPTEDEWYKAAYYTGSGYSLYANGTDTLPVAGIDSNYGTSNSSNVWLVGSGTVEQNGTYDMMGNVWEWTESMNRRGGASNSGIAGGHLASTAVFPTDPTAENQPFGFRVVEIVPEPATLSLLIISSISLLGVRHILRVH